VDSIFLKKHIEERDIVIKTMKEKIKDLEDMNRELEERGSNDDEESTTFRVSLEESSKKFDEILVKKGPAIPNPHTTVNPKIVKVLKGGQQ